MAEGEGHSGQQIDLMKVVTVTPDVPPMAPIAKAGVELAKWLLIIVSAFIVVMVLLMGWIETSLQKSCSLLLTPPANAEAASVMKEVIAQLEAQTKAFREFWLQSIQIILLNFLLPVLTAILGYVFATKEGNRSSD